MEEKPKLKYCTIIPAFNEERHIAQVIDEAKKYSDLIIVIDDGSKDATVEIAKKHNVIVLKHPINGGKGVALQTGFLYAKKLRTNIVITIDADLQHDASKIPEFIQTLIEKNADIVIGSRSMGGSAPFVYRFGNFVLNTTFRLLYGQKITDTQSGYRAFRMDKFDGFAWASSGYDVETEMLTNARKHGLKLVELPIATKYHNSYKGTTIFDGIKIFCKMLFWRI